MVLTVGIGVLRGQSSGAPAALPLVSRIRAGDIVAIDQAGRSGNREYIPYLRNIRRDPVYLGVTDESPAEQARVALAKLGDAAALQEFWCATTSEQPTRVGLDPPISAFGFIGGWYSVQALRTFLGPNGGVHQSKAASKARTSGDFTYLSARFTALQVLPTVLRDAPIKQSATTIAEERRLADEWQTWIAGHAEDLRRMEPTGDGVDFSDRSCKDGKPVKSQR
jgi:hypothetical protein